MENNSVVMQRGVVLDGIKALLYTLRGMRNLFKDDSYSAGYQTGFEDACTAMARFAGLDIQQVKNDIFLSSQK